MEESKRCMEELQAESDNGNESLEKRHADFYRIADCVPPGDVQTVERDDLFDETAAAASIDGRFEVFDSRKVHSALHELGARVKL